MQRSTYCATGWEHGHGWGRGHHGSPFMLFIGLFVVFAIFKSGLWLPLFGLGLLAFAFAHMRGDWQPGFGPRSGWQYGTGPRGFGPRGGWQPDWKREGGEEKPKRPFGPMAGRPWYGQFEPEGEKPKRDQHDDEYV